LPSHFDGIALENLICDCWAKVEWGYGRILIRDGANAGWINYMLKDRQKSEFDGFVDCIIIESLHNPIADAWPFFWNGTLHRPSLKQGRLISSRLVSRYCAGRSADRARRVGNGLTRAWEMRATRPTRAY